jgi:hypothetical protein
VLLPLQILVHQVLTLLSKCCLRLLSKLRSQLIHIYRDPTSGAARKAALISLDILRKKALDEVGSTGEPAITYLRARNLLPFFYRCLKDTDA